jgi:cytosine/uracil/thiamine/allantoin permease
MYPSCDLLCCLTKVYSREAYVCALCVYLVYIIHTARSLFALGTIALARRYAHNYVVIDVWAAFCFLYAITYVHIWTGSETVQLSCSCSGGLCWVPFLDFLWWQALSTLVGSELECKSSLKPRQQGASVFVHHRRLHLLVWRKMWVIEVSRSGGCEFCVTGLCTHDMCVRV